MGAPDLRPKLDMEVCDEPEPEPEPEPGTSQASKRRKVVRRTVLRVKMEENVGKQRNNEGPPSDFWSWRKYGQKPIKGSPYPRGYYRCSTSKGCSAKKQVERCKTDASVLVITYTSTHNHPGPDIHSITNINHPTQQSPIHPPETSLSSPTNSSNQGDQDQEQEQEQEKEREREQQLDGDSINSSSDTDNQDQQQQQQQRQPHLLTSREGHTKPEEDAYFHYLPSPARYCPQDPFSLAIDKTGEEDHPDLPLHMDDEEPLSCSHHIMSSAHHVAPKSSSEDSCDFFDELEELPTYSSFSYFKRPSNYYLVDERIRVVPS